MKKLTKLRHNACLQQSSRCYYCNLPIWEGSSANFIAQYRLTEAQAKLFQCTAEHLLARSEGGKDIESNIVAACRFCNSTRHKSKTPLKPDAYKRAVQNRLLNGHWIDKSLRHLCSTNVVLSQSKEVST